MITCTGVILSANVEVWKISLKACHGIHGDILPEAEPSGDNDFGLITDGASVTIEKLIKSYV